MRAGAGSKIQKAVAIVCVLLLPSYLSFGQAPAGLPQEPPVAQQPGPLLSPEQLDNLVAPVALYPDPLLGEVLAASTYPLEIVEVQQWLQQNRNLQGAQLVDAAKQQNWDPSVQALVAFPDAMNLLSHDIRWTTDLGNAFLAQQADVMSAVQRMRVRARANGNLASTPQQIVTTDNQEGQSAIEIQPANPQVIYVPVYQPEYVFGPPVWGAYPDLWYPPGFGFGFGFGPGIFIGGFFPGWGGWGGWGWGCGWFGHSLFVNAGFFHHYGFRGGFGGGSVGRGFEGRGLWAHDPGHRMGVPYPNQAVASRFNSSRFNGNGRKGGQTSAVQSNRGSAGVGANGSGWRSFNSGNRAAANGSAGSNRQASPNYGRGYASQSYRAPAQSYSGYNSTASYRSAPSYNRSSVPAYSAPRSYSAPRQNFSAPHHASGGFSGGRSGFSGGRSGFSSGHSGFSGGHSGSSGGHSGGGGGHAGGGRR